MAPDQQRLTQLCQQTGLDLVGVANPTPPQHLDFYLHWLDQGMHGEMDYMKSRQALRSNPKTLMPSVKSILCFAWNYHVPTTTEQSEVEIARYARGKDYHQLFKEKLRNFWQALLDAEGMTSKEAGKVRFFVDSAPILERDYAASAGLGWIGKNTCLIHPQLGSWLFLGEIFTELELNPTPTQPDRCGTCTACIDACPTDALRQPYTLDSNRCISYLTIEKRTPLSKQESSWLDNHVFGCDICQEVCPWNRKAKPGSFFADGYRQDLNTPTLKSLDFTDEDTFNTTMAATPIVRTTWSGWQRNLQAVRNNREGDHE